MLRWGEVGGDVSDEREDGRRREGGRRARVIRRDRAPVGRLITRGTHSLRRCSSMHPWQKRWRQGETTLTFFRVPQQMAHRVSARTDPSFTDILAEISARRRWIELGPGKTGEKIVRMPTVRALHRVFLWHGYPVRTGVCLVIYQ